MSLRIALAAPLLASVLVAPAAGLASPAAPAAAPTSIVDPTAQPDTASEPTPLRTIPVATSAELAAATAAAVPGDAIVLADGEYTVGKISNKQATAEHPITIAAANPGGAVVTGGQIEIVNSRYVTVRGLVWRNGNTVKLTASTHLRVTRNQFLLQFEPPEDPASSRHWLLISGEGSGHHRIDHNTFSGKTLLGNYITVYGGATQISQYDRIDHNYFRDSPAQAANGGEAVRIGVTPLTESSAFTVVEHNLFENCDSDPEIVSIKSNDNTIRYNTFRTSAGAVVARRGDRNAIHGNFFLGGGKPGTGGVRLYGRDQRVFNNYFEGLTGSGYLATIQIDGGDVDTEGSLSGHWRVYRATIVHNTFVNNASTIEVGANYLYPPVDSVIANNIVVGSAGKLFHEHKVPVNLRYAGNIAHPTGDATVGVSAPPHAIRVADPRLAFVDGLYRLRPGPAINTAVGDHPFVTDDIDGQCRDRRPDVGADEFADTAVVRRPLDPTDVGA